MLVLGGFVGGSLAALTFHQVVWAVFAALGAIPAGNPAWPVDAVWPFGVPRIVSIMFWGGVWGVPLMMILRRYRTAPAYWIAATLFGGLLVAAVAMCIVLPLRGLPFAGGFAPGTLAGAFLINAAWSLGAAWILRRLRWT
jgi:hypothetical protein